MEKSAGARGRGTEWREAGQHWLSQVHGCPGAGFNASLSQVAGDKGKKPGDPAEPDPSVSLVSAADRCLAVGMLLNLSCEMKVDAWGSQEPQMR